MGTETRSKRSKRVANRDRAAARVKHLRLFDSCDAPELGLAPDVLRDRWAGEPVAGWDDVRLAEISEAAIAVCSQLIGSAAGNRKSATTAARQLVLAATTGWVAPDPDAASGSNDPSGQRNLTANRSGGVLRAPYAAAGWELTVGLGGWGGGVMSWRKLYAYGSVPLELDAGIPLPHEFRMENERDHRALDLAWGQVAGSLHRRLPAPILTAFLAGPREVDGVHVPGVIEAAALLLAWGPFGARRAMIRSLRQQGETAGRRTIMNYATMLDGFVRAARDVSSTYTILRELSWHEHWSSLKDEARKIETRHGEGRKRDTTSPGLLQTRRSFKTWHARVVRHRRRDGTLRDSARRDHGYYTLGVLHVSTSGRIGMTAQIAPRDVERRGVVGEFVGPVVWVNVNKNERLGREPRPVHAHVIDTVDEHCELFDIPRDDPLPLWRDADGHVLDTGTLIHRFSREASAHMPALIARVDGRHAASHTTRSLGDPLIRFITARLMAARPELAGRIDPAAAADLWLGHGVRTDRYGYQDVEANRDWWLVRIGAGDPEYGIPGLGDLLFGEAGARQGWDIEAIRDALLRRDAARELVRELDRQVAAIRAERERILGKPFQVVIPALRSVGEGEALLDEVRQNRPVTTGDLMFVFERLCGSLTTVIHDVHTTTMTFQAELAETGDRRNRERGQLDAELDRLVDSRADRRVELARAELDLDRLKEAGRAFPLEDELPTTAELRAGTRNPDVRAAEDESWKEALARAGGSEDRPCARRRDWLNVSELAMIVGVDTTTILRWRKAETNSDMGRGVARATWVELSSKLAFVKADTLPLHMLIPSQVEFVETLLSEPMGTWGGRRRTDAEIEAAVRAERPGSAPAD